MKDILKIVKSLEGSGLLLKGVSETIKDEANIFRIQAYGSVMCGYFCIRFVDFMLKGNSLTDFTNLFSPNNFKKRKVDIILNYFLTNL